MVRFSSNVKYTKAQTITHNNRLYYTLFEPLQNTLKLKNIEIASIELNIECQTSWYKEHVNQ